MSLPTLPKVEKLQAALHAKAKRSPSFRFYSLYDKVYRPDVLWQAYQQCRHNGGVPGVDRMTFEDIEKYGEKKWLSELAEELRTKQYRPQPVQRVYVPKPNGKQRPLGIPTVKDRVVQTAAMLVLILGWKLLGHEQRLRAKIVNYADDFVICCRGTADEAMSVMRSMMERLKLTVNEQKTRLCRLPGETFDFLSYTFGRQWSRQTGGSYLGMRPSQKALRRLREHLHEETARKWLWKSPEEMAQGLNRLLVGWSNYFRVGTIARAWGSVDHYVFQRLRQWWCRKYRIRNRRDARFSAEYLYQQMGVVCLRDVRSSSRERRRNSGPRAGCGKTARPVR